jgi:hypothetical protein
MNEELEQQQNHPLRQRAAEQITRTMALAGVVASLGGPATAKGYEADHLPAATPVERSLDLPSMEASASGTHHRLVLTRESRREALSLLARSNLDRGIDSENAPIPAKVKAEMNKNAAYMQGSGCSGSIIRNAKGKAIGALTAEHCSLRNADNRRIEGSDGKVYIVQEPVLARTGSDRNKLRTVAHIKQYIAPPAGDTVRDIVLGVAAGHTPAEVYKAYNKTALTQRQAEKLTGGNLWNSGWPIDQPDNPTNMRRQDMKMTILGPGTTITTLGERIDVIWAAVKDTKDGAKCSFGDSGSRGFVMVDGKARSVGTLSAFIDLTDSVPGVAGAQPNEASLARIKGVSAICGFAYKQVKLGKDAEVLNSVSSPEQIRGYVSRDRAIQEAHDQFLNPDLPKLTINGYAETYDGGEGSNKGGGFQYVDEPVIYYNPSAQGVVVIKASASTPDHLSYSFHDVNQQDGTIPSLPLYSHELNGSATFASSSGTEQYVADDSGNTEGSFVDANGLSVGSILQTEPDLSQRSPSFLRAINGQLVIDGSLKGKG